MEGAPESGETPSASTRRFDRRAFILTMGTAGLGAAVAAVVGKVAHPFGHGNEPDTSAAPAAGSSKRGQHGSKGHKDNAAGSSADKVAGSVISRWSDPRTWGGRVPGSSSVPTIKRTVLLDVDARVAGVVIKPGGALIFDPARSRTLRSTGNVVVEGRLQIRPRSGAVVHSLVFEGVRESRFVGGGMDVLRSDVGLWVMRAGVLDAVGTKKMAWTRAAGSIASGARSISLESTPSGWRIGDEIAITPTVGPKVQNHSSAYDVATVTAIRGRTVVLSRSTRYAHPRVAVGGGKSYGAEVLNLSRNVRIEGTPGGRAHVMVRAGRRQRVGFVALRHLGPRQGGPVLGRYGLHFHHGGGGTRGTVVEGVVVRDAGNHAYVTHSSDGITLRNCISHNTVEDAYWWDLSETTNTVTWDRCVASLVRAEPYFRGYTLTGFFFGKGSGSAARGCVAVGVQGNLTASGFHWPGAKSEGVWVFQDCLSHNTNVHGIRVWQNTTRAHEIKRFVAYHCGEFGIAHGAYSNPYRYRDVTLYGNRAGAISLHAISAGGKLLFEDVLCDGGGLSDSLVVTDKHNVPGKFSTTFRGCTFRGQRKNAIVVSTPANAKAPDLIDLVDCDISSNEFWLDSNIRSDCLVRLIGAETLSIRRFDQAGEFRPEWNARVVTG